MNARISKETPIGGCLERLVGKPTATDKTVRDLPVKVKLKIGQIIAEQKLCGVVFSFPAVVWPDDPMRQRAWIMRLTPWWDMAALDWTPQAQRLRESCLKAINNLAAIQSEQEGARMLKATPGIGGAVRLETHCVAGCIPNAPAQTPPNVP
jgi:hypothetical protein